MSRQSYVRKQYKRQLLTYGFLICGLCKKRITDFENISVDHVKPKSKGGSTTVDNLQPSHRNCNWQKGNKEV